MRATRPAVVIGMITPLLLLAGSIVWSQTSSPVDVAVDAPMDAPVDAAFTKAADRYWKILSRRPRRGVAFDQWYRLYLDAGQLDVLTARVETNAEDNPTNANAQLLLGMILERSNQAEEAIEVYAAASKLAPDNYHMSFMLGSLYARQLNYENAETALQRALQLKPPRTDLLDISKQLARIQLRQRKNEAAQKTLAVLATQFPTDRRVLTELAELLQSENQFDAAIERWQAVARLVSEDPFEKIRANLAIATIHSQQGKSEQSIAELDALLEQVRPDGWIAGDLRDRIETVFLRTNDREGLLAYCRQRAVSHADEPESLLQLAKTVAKFGDSKEAVSTLQKALLKVPTNQDIHKALIAEHLKARQFDLASEQALLLASRHKKDIDVLLLAGKTILHQHRDRYELSPAAQQAQRDTLAIWKRIAEIRPTDPSLSVQVANACREAAKLKSAAGGLVRSARLRREYYQDVPLIAGAEQFYRRAVANAVDNPEYNEFLGEFLFDVGRTDEALSTFAKIISPDTETSPQWYRLAGLYRRFNFMDESVAAARKAIELDDDNYQARDTLVSLLFQQEDFQAVLAELPKLEAVADSDARRDIVLGRYVEAWTAVDGMARAVQQLSLDAEDDSLSVEARVRNRKLIAMLFDTQNDPTGAAESIARALELQPDSIKLRERHAKLLDQAGSSEEAIGEYRELIQRAPQLSTRIRLQIVRLLMRQGNGSRPGSRTVGSLSEAVAEFKLILKSPPTSPDELVVLSGVAADLRLADESQDLLRKAVRANPSDVDIRMQLANSLAARRADQDAMEHYRHCLDLTEDLKGRLQIVNSMATVAKEGRFTKQLVDELRNLPLEPREQALMLAEALVVAGRSADATRELETLLLRDSQDAFVMNRLADIWSSRKLWKQAVRQRERVARLTNDPEILKQLATDYERAEDYDGLATVMTTLVAEFGQGEHVAKRMDATLRRGNLILAGRLAEALQSEAVADGNVDLLYRIALAYVPRVDKRSDAYEIFRGIVESTESAPIARGAQSTGRTNSVRRHSIVYGSFGIQPQVEVAVDHDVFANLWSPVFEPFHEVEHLRAAFGMLKSGNGAGIASGRNTRGSVYANRMTSIGRAVTVMDALQQPDNRHEMWNRSLAAMRVVDPDACVAWIAKQAETNKRYGEYGLLAAIAGTKPGVDLIRKQMAEYPDNEIPRLAMFMSRVTAPKEQPAKAAMAKTVREAYAWLQTHQPKAASELIMNYAVQLDLLGDSSESAKVIGLAAAEADDLKAWNAVLNLLRNFSDAKLRRDVLQHIETYCARETTPAVEVHALLVSELSDPAVSASSEEFAELVLPLFGYCFDRANNSALSAGLQTQNTTSLRSAYQFASVESNRYKSELARLKTIPASKLTDVDRASIVRYQREFKRAEARRQVLMSQLRVAATRTNRILTVDFSVNGFPSACSLMSRNELSWMQRCVTELGNRDWETAFVKWLELKQQAVTSDVLSQKYQLLTVYSHWWFGERPESLQKLKQLAQGRTDDIRLLESEAYHANGQTSLALASMNWMQDNKIPDPLRVRAVRRRSEILKLVCSQTDYDEIAECLKLELNSFTQPALEPFFVRRGTQRVNANSVSVLPIYAGPMVNLLDHIDATISTAPDRLAGLETAASKRLQQYPEDAQLGALTALIRERQGRPEAGLEPLEVWKKFRQPGAKRTIPTWRDPITGRMLALAFARHKSTRETALELVAERLIADAATSSVAMRVLLGDITRTREAGVRPETKSASELTDQLKRLKSKLGAARAGSAVAGLKADELSKLEKQLKSLQTQIKATQNQLQTLSANASAGKSSSEFDQQVIQEFMDVLYREIDEQPEFERLVAARRMMQCMPTPMVPKATKMMTKLLVAKSDEWEDKNNIIRSVHEAIERAETELTDHEREELLQVVHDMVFVNGDQKLPQPLAWEEKADRRMRRGAIANMLIRVASLNGELADLREKWDAHPQASHPTMLLLRLEAAAAADDDVAADKLIAEFRSLPEARQAIAPWSSALRAPLEPDSWMAEWILQRGGRLWINPGERVFTLDQIPTEPYKVTRIMIAGTGFPSEFVADLQGQAKATNLFLRTTSQLEQLKSLQILYLPVSDHQMRHLSSCKNLVDLKIENAPITDAVVDVLSTLKSLEVLVLRDTSLTDDGVARLRKALPNCDVEVE